MVLATSAAENMHYAERTFRRDVNLADLLNSAGHPLDDNDDFLYRKHGSKSKTDVYGFDGPLGESLKTLRCC